jgi:hypothetical protein
LGPAGWLSRTYLALGNCGLLYSLWCKKVDFWSYLIIFDAANTYMTDPIFAGLYYFLMPY